MAEEVLLPGAEAGVALTAGTDPVPGPVRQQAEGVPHRQVVGPDGAVIPGSEGLTTPGPVEIARWMRRLRDIGVSAVAMEVSSHALHQARVGAVRFDAALFTNLSRDHLDYHGTLDEYRAAKLVLRGLLKEGGAVVVNADDPARQEVQNDALRAMPLLQLADSYICYESPDGMVIVDQHAAHERVLYEHAMRLLEGEGMPAQRLLMAETIELTDEELEVVASRGEELKLIGYELEPFGGRSVVIHATPDPHLGFDAVGALRHLVADLARGHGLRVAAVAASARPAEMLVACSRAAATS